MNHRLPGSSAQHLAPYPRAFSSLPAFPLVTLTPVRSSFTSPFSVLQAQSLPWKALGILKLLRSVASPQAREAITFANISIMSPSAFATA